jgi:hypothetical protein
VHLVEVGRGEKRVGGGENDAESDVRREQLLCSQAGERSGGLRWAENSPAPRRREERTVLKRAVLKRELC